MARNQENNLWHKTISIMLILESWQAIQANWFERSEADPCLIFAWREEGLVIWVTWIDNDVIISPPNIANLEKEMMQRHFECDNIWNMIQSIGCKIKKGSHNCVIKITQPESVQSLQMNSTYLRALPTCTPVRHYVNQAPRTWSIKSQKSYQSSYQHGKATTSCIKLKAGCWKCNLQSI